MSKSPPPETVREQEEEVIEWLYLNWLAFSNFAKAKGIEHFSQTKCGLHGRKKPPRVILFQSQEDRWEVMGLQHGNTTQSRNWKNSGWWGCGGLKTGKPQRPDRIAAGETSRKSLWRSLKIQERKSHPQISTYGSSNQVRSFCLPSIL